MHEAVKLAGYLGSPLTLALALALLAIGCAAAGARRWATVLGAVAVTGLWVASLPITAQALAAPLEASVPALTPEATPPADAIIVLGGALSGARPPRRPTFNLAPAAGRVWHAAALYRAGKARWIIVAAGEQQVTMEQTEGEAIAQMLQTLGVPRPAILLDTASRNTRENAANAGQLARKLQAHRFLLVTSAIHMPRALRTFQAVTRGDPYVYIPAAADFWLTREQYGPEMWIPSVQSLGLVTSLLKEYAGNLALDIMPKSHL